ncbi:MAG: 4a-hydroxytetrahydrobiopterin dehydratase [Alteromonadaceae bacterium]|nr:MAG: 4a-hydroxytetrahydrobiopterin dehydratase [Alteromonadaceae bacterium]
MKAENLSPKKQPLKKLPLEKLSKEKIEEELLQLNEQLSTLWVLREGKLYKLFKFTDFVAAFGFMTKCALYAEKVNHHPEWFNVYRSVEVSLTTHEVAGISYKDFALARKMEAYAA